MEDMFSSFAKAFGSDVEPKVSENIIRQEDEDVNNIPVKNEGSLLTNVSSQVHSDDQNSEYDAYVNSVENFNEHLKTLNNAKKIVDSGQASEKAHIDRIAQIENDYKSRIIAKVREKETKKAEVDCRSAEIKKQTDPNAADLRQFKYIRTTPDPDISGMLKSTQSSLSPRQQKVIHTSVEEMCGTGNKIDTNETFIKLEKAFKNNPVCTQLMTGTPDEKFIKTRLAKIPYILSAILFVLILIGGEKMEILNKLIYYVSFIVMFPIIGIIVSYFAYFLLISMFAKDKGKSILWMIVAGIVGFFVIGSPIASVSAKAISNMTSSIGTRVIIGGILAVVAFIALSVVLYSKRIIGILQKSGIMRKLMIKRLFLDNDGNEELELQIYSYLHHDTICNYFEKQFSAYIVAKLNTEIEQLKRDIIKYDEEITALENKKDADLSLEKQKHKKFVIKINVAERELKKCSEKLDAAKKAITKWNGSPKLDSSNNTALKDYICIENTYNEQSVFSVVKLPEKGHGFGLEYVVTQDMDDITNRIKATIAAFTKMNPIDMMDISVVCLNSKAIMIRKKTLGQLDWIVPKHDAVGGTGSKTTGRILLVKNLAELRDFVNVLNTRVEDQDNYLMQNRGTGKDDIVGISLRDINEYRAKRASSPFKYQIVLIVTENYDHETERVYKEMFSTMETLNDACIPVLFLAKGTQLAPLWKEKCP